jgi:hypothetical protein
VLPTDRADKEKWLERLERMSEEYRADQHRQLLQHLSKCRRLAEADKVRVAEEELSRAN